MILICALKYILLCLGSVLKCDICLRHHPEDHPWLYIPTGEGGTEQRWGQCCHEPPYGRTYPGYIRDYIEQDWRGLEQDENCGMRAYRSDNVSHEEMARYCWDGVEKWMFSKEYFEAHNFSTQEFWDMVRSGKLVQDLVGSIQHYMVAYI